MALSKDFQWEDPLTVSKFKYDELSFLIACMMHCYDCLSYRDTTCYSHVHTYASFCPSLLTIISWRLEMYCLREGWENALICRV